MTRRGATPRRSWPSIRLPRLALPRVHFRVSFWQPVVVVFSLGVFAAGLAMGGRWLTPETVQWEIEGNLLFQDEQAILDHLHRVEDSYWGLSLTALEQELRAFPWLDRVVLERQWPDRVRVQVVEQTPLAFWNDDAFINSRGEVFGPSELSFELPRLAGPEGRAEDVMANYLRFSQMFSSMGYRIEALTLADRGAWELELDNGIKVRLGQRQILQRARRVARVLAVTNDSQQADNIAVLDARYQYGVAVAWKSGETA
ncbi:FtsQ-type POTRA domain-containing protein [Natronospirillum operosum]|uniref:Cell division protein FtsQ n=1 Tax=Natronospirillum operosum TaxID=2759953 RepID=A0A4Z0WDC3_9GAMM|nr:cell division protein FtsQ/DivIB [Natronospirillum operosum]TGG92729.1 FtsQ-type POTRA domain-containing protein [Natronospirillum operosum]